MRSLFLMSAAGLAVLGGLAAAQGPSPGRPNPTIDLLKAKKPVFGLYTPSVPRAPRTAGAASAAPVPPVPVRTQADLAKDALAYDAADFLFSGAMERGLDGGLPAFTEFTSAAATSPARFRHPLAVKTPKIAADPAKAIENISRQLNLGVSTIVFVDVESAAEVQQGLAAMRFKFKGGTRPEAVGSAPQYWGMTEAQYRDKADLWPLNPNGELVNWTIVESKEGLARIREIAAVKGIGVLFPGAGTLRGVFSTTDAEGRRVVDTVAWEAAIQQVLAACKEFGVACGYPATADDIEMRMAQGFSVFIMGWGDGGFKAIETGRRAAGGRR